MANLAADDLDGHAAHGVGDVVHEPLALLVIEQTEEIAGLGVVVIADAMIVALGIAGDRERRFAKAGILALNIAGVTNRRTGRP